MGHHIDCEGRFQSDKYPELGPDKIVVSFKHPEARRALRQLAEGYRARDVELTNDIHARLDALNHEALKREDGIHALEPCGLHEGSCLARSAFWREEWQRLAALPGEPLPEELAKAIANPLTQADRELATLPQMRVRKIETADDGTEGMICYLPLFPTAAQCDAAGRVVEHRAMLLYFGSAAERWRGTECFDHAWMAPTKDGVRPMLGVRVGFTAEDVEGGRVPTWIDTTLPVMRTSRGGAS